MKLEKLKKLFAFCNLRHRKKKSEFIYRMFNSQKISFHPGDWVCLIGNDKIILGLELTEEEIERLSKKII